MNNQRVDTLVREPVYQQLNDRLRALVRAEFHVGDQFLTERSVSERFGVSRATANKALAGLVSEGLLDFKKGRGTFVRSNPLHYDVRRLVSFTERAREGGRRPATEVLELSKADVSALPESARSVFGTEAVGWAMTRLRKADATPVILERRWVDRRHCEKLTRSALAGSLYDHWTETLGLEIGGADEVIRAVPLSAKDAGRLGVTSRTPALEVESIGKLASGDPLWWERTLYRADQYEFASRLGPPRSATPARGRFRKDGA